MVLIVLSPNEPAICWRLPFKVVMHVMQFSNQDITPPSFGSLPSFTSECSWPESYDQGIAIHLPDDDVSKRAQE